MFSIASELDTPAAPITCKQCVMARPGLSAEAGDNSIFKASDIWMVVGIGAAIWLLADYVTKTPTKTRSY